VKIVQRVSWNARLLDQVNHLGQAYGRDADMVTGSNRGINEGGSRTPQA
jgi:hypothetical protein